MTRILWILYTPYVHKSNTLLIFQIMLERSVYCCLALWTFYRTDRLGFSGTLFQIAEWWCGESVHKWSRWWLLVGDMSAEGCISIDWFFKNRVIVILFSIITIVRSTKSKIVKGPWRVHYSPYHSCMFSWKARISAVSRSSSYIFHRHSTLSMICLYRSKLFSNHSIRVNSKTP